MLETPAGQVSRAQGDIHPGGNPHYLADPRNGGKVAKAMAACFAKLDPLQEMRGNGVAQRVAMRRLGDAGGQHRGADGPLDRGLMQVVVPVFARLGVVVAPRGGEDPLPRPLVARVGVLEAQSVGHLDPPGADGQVGLVRYRPRPPARRRGDAC